MFIVNGFGSHCGCERIKTYIKKRKRKKRKEKRNVMFTTFSQQIKSDTFLQVIIGGQKGNFNSRFKLEPIIM